MLYDGSIVDVLTTGVSHVSTIARAFIARHQSETQEVENPAVEGLELKYIGQEATNPD